jgi:hypothetical protein
MGTQINRGRLSLRAVLAAVRRHKSTPLRKEKEEKMHGKAWQEHTAVQGLGSIEVL